MPGTLEGKVALVTGASSGIGRASALASAQEGAIVVVADVAVEGSEETVRLVGDAGGDAIGVKCDVSKSSGVKAVVNVGHRDLCASELCL